MADLATLQRFGQLYSAGYIPSVGAWVQVDPDNGLTTIFNAFNTLGNQLLELTLADPSGDTVATYVPDSALGTNKTLRLDLEDLFDPDDLPFEGCIWVWAKGDDSQGAIGLQSIDLDFVDRSRPAGHTLGSVHLIFDFLNTLGQGPYMDYVGPRIMTAETPEGSQRYLNYLGLAHIPLDLGNSGATVVITITNEDGDTWSADPIELASMGSWFGSLEALFPGLPDFLAREDGTGGYGALGVQEASNRITGLCGMVKLVDVLTSTMLVNHINDRNFARPAQKEG